MFMFNELLEETIPYLKKRPARNRFGPFSRPGRGRNANPDPESCPNYEARKKAYEEELKKQKEKEKNDSK